MLTRKDMNKLVSLLYLLSVSQNASKRKASEKLDTSIDTINKYLGDLEQDLGSKLLASNGRGTQTTPEALEILPLGQTLKSILREVEFLATKNSEISGVVRLSVEDGVTSTLLNGKFLDVFRRYPGLQIQTENGNGLSGLSLLDYDIAMSYTPPSGSDLTIYHAQTVRCGLYASPSYIEEFGMPYDMDDLLNNHRFCEQIYSSRQIKGWKELRKDIKHITYSSNSTYSVHYMTEAGAGISVFPVNWKTENLISVTNIIDECSIDLSYPVYLIAHRDTMKLPRVSTVLECLRRIMDDADNIPVDSNAVRKTKAAAS